MNQLAPTVSPARPVAGCRRQYLEKYLVAYLAGAGLRDDPKGPLFGTMAAALAS